MRTINEYMSLPYKMDIIPDLEEGGYVITFPDLTGCLSIGDSVEEAVQNGLDAKRAWLKSAIENGITINEPDF